MENNNSSQKTNTTVAIDAIEINQAGHRIYVTSLTAQQLIDSTCVDYYNSQLAPGDPNQGYQRPPERSRITKIGSYLIKRQGEGLYPTAVLLGARTPLRWDPVSRRLELPLNNTLRIIDGQHRRDGLRYAIEEKGVTEFSTMQLPVVILEAQNRVEEMDQFRIVNGTAKSVRTDLVNAILTALVDGQGEDAIPEKDLWKVIIMKTVDKLDRHEDSPWKDMLLMPDEVGTSTAPHKVTRATSMITSIRPIYDWLRNFGFLANMTTDEASDFMAEILIAYWRAIRSVVPDAFSNPNDYVIQKTPGLFALHYLLRDRLLTDIHMGRRQWDESTFREFIQESPEITDPDFWHKESDRASVYGSMKGFRDLADLLIGSVEP